MTSFNKQVKCAECEHEFIMVFIADKGKVVNRIDPEFCPECGSNVFTGEFTTDPKNWFGTFGSNG
jgi:DNA-directed RNA polymerase subunit RPC12/RpoP